MTSMNCNLLVLSIPVLFWISSCQQGVGDKSGKETPDVGTVAIVSGEIELTKDQFESMAMEVGDPLTMMFSNAISANGYIVASPSGSAKISTLISGRVRQINHSAGDYIQKGQVLFSLESNEIILLQQEYAEALHALHVLEADHERLKALSEEKIVAQKEFLKTESEYRSMLSKAKGLNARLKMIRIDPAQVEKGNLIPYVSVASPISGTISKLELVLGQFVEPQETVLEVIDNKSMQLKLHVFEKDLAGLAIGQQVLFKTPDNRDSEFEASISHIGKSINPETRVVECLAQIKPANQGNFLNNLFVETRIYICQREAKAIPEQALIKEAERSYVLILQEENEDRMIFRKIPVHIGVTRGGFSEVMDENLTDVLLEGAYNLWPED